MHNSHTPLRRDREVTALLDGGVRQVGGEVAAYGAAPFTGSADERTSSLATAAAQLAAT